MPNSDFDRLKSLLLRSKSSPHAMDCLNAIRMTGFILERATRLPQSQFLRIWSGRAERIRTIAGDSGLDDVLSRVAQQPTASIGVCAIPTRDWNYLVISDWELQSLVGVVKLPVSEHKR